MIKSAMAGYTVYTYLIEPLSVYTREKLIEASCFYYSFTVCDWGYCGTESHSAAQPDAINVNKLAKCAHYEQLLSKNMT